MNILAIFRFSFITELCVQFWEPGPGSADMADGLCRVPRRVQCWQGGGWQRDCWHWWQELCSGDVFMSQIVLYLLHSTSVLLFLSFYIDVVFTLSTGYFYVFVDLFADRPRKILSCIIPINQDGALDSLQLSQQHRYDRVKATYVNEIKTNSHQCLLGAMIRQSLHMGHKYTPILGCGHRQTLLRQFNFYMLCPVLILSDSTFLSIDFNAKYF